MKRRESGSAHVAIVIVLVVALLGALGYIFYQNFIAKSHTDSSANNSDKSSPKPSTPPKTVATKPLAMTTVFKNGLSLSYPETWNVTHESPQGEVPPTDESTTMDNYIFTSPDNTVSLKVQQTSGGGIGGTCDPDDTPKIATYAFENSSGWQGHTYVEYSLPNDTFKGTIVFQSITSGDSAKTTKAGDSGCNAGFFNVDSTGRFVNTASPIIMFSNIFKVGSTDSSIEFANAAAAKEYLESQNAKDIKSILLSIH